MIRPAVKASKPSSPAPQVIESKPKAPDKAPDRRDPFVSPIRSAATGDASCRSGKRCLMIAELNVKGVVQTQGRMMALVENASQRSYVLYEGDAVQEGVVVRINPDSVVFRETVTDALGHRSTHDVVKQLAKGSADGL